MSFWEQYFEKIISVVWILIVSFILNKIIDNIIDKTIKIRRKKNVTTMLIFFKRIKKLIIFVIAILISLSRFDMFNQFSMTILSGLGIGSVVVGLAAQESLKNFFGTLAIVSGNPFEVGDFIECVEKNVSGTVEDITMRHTVIRTINNRRVIIPNNEMNELVIENFNYSDNELVKTVEYLISYDADIDKAIKIIQNEMKKIYTINPKGKNKDVEYPRVKVGAWLDNGISLKAWVWGKDNGNVFDNIYDLNYNVKKKFDKEGIEIPYPHVKLIEDKKKTRKIVKKSKI